MAYSRDSASQPLKVWPNTRPISDTYEIIRCLIGNTYELQIEKWRNKSESRGIFFHYHQLTWNFYRNLSISFIYHTLFDLKELRLISPSYSISVIITRNNWNLKLFAKTFTSFSLINSSSFVKPPWRSFPRGHRYKRKQKYEKNFYVWLLFLLSYTPDKHSLYSAIALYNKMNHTHFD